MWKKMKGRRRWGVLLSHVAEALLNRIKDSLYKTKKLRMQQEEGKLPWYLVRSLTSWLQNSAFPKPFSPIWFISNTWLHSGIKPTRREVSVPAKNSIILVACYSSDLSGFVFTQKDEYWNQVSFILGESFNYWAIAERGYQQQLFLQLCFKLKERGMVSSMGKNKKGCP